MKYYFMVILIAIMACSCSNSKEEKKRVDPIVSPKKSKEEVDKKLEEMMVSIPSPLEMAAFIKRNKLKYKKELLLSPNDYRGYLTPHKIAVALGVYGTDINYSTLYDDNGTAVKYLKGLSRFSEELGLENVLNIEELSQKEVLLQNKDSLTETVSSILWEIDSYLKEEQRSDILSYLLSGGWVEAIYLCTATIDESTSDKVKLKIVDQKIVLDQLIQSIEESKSQEVESLLKQLHVLKKAFDQQSEDDIDSVAFNHLVKVISEIRQELIKNEAL